MSNKGRTLKEKKMLNRVVVLGRLTKDPELRKSASDVSFATFSVAVDNTAKEADGTRGTLFLDCRVFGAQAESVAKYTSKGSKVVVDGSLNQRNFLRKDGTQGKAIELYADSVTFLDPKPEEPKEPDTAELPNDDLPFKGEEAKPQEEPTPKFDPYTGKPLKAKGKK